MLLIHRLLLLPLWLSHYFVMWKVRGVLSSLADILLRKKDLVALL